MGRPKTAEAIEMPFGIWPQKKHALSGVHTIAHCSLENTTEPSMCGGDAACCQNTLTTVVLVGYVYTLLHNLHPY